MVVDDKKISLTSSTEQELPETQPVDSVLALQDILDLQRQVDRLLACHDCGWHEAPNFE